MTREEAVEVIKDFVAYGKHVNAFVYKGSTAIPIEALNMAIEALEQEETLQNLTKPNKSDLIVKGAGEIKDGLYNIKGGKLFQYKANGGTVRTYPIVSADRPTGHWIENAQEYYEMINEKGGGVDENTPYFTDDIACSECLAKFSVIDNETERFDFCPNCGCAMKGGEEE